MQGVMDSLVKATEKTGGKRYQSHKFCYDHDNNSVIEYDEDKKNVEWLEFGETEKPTKNISMENILHQIESQPSMFKYFLDGSRHTYKVDDMAFGKGVYPILAGQVGISCCKRKDKEMQRELFNRKLVVVLPSRALKSQWKKDTQLEEIKKLINDTDKLKHYNLKFDNILYYDMDDDEKYEKKGIAKIQDYMIEQEKLAVIELVDAGKIKDGAYLIKDGSLEYKAVKDKNLSLSEGKFKNYFNYVIGVSKSFNPTKCYVKGGGSDASIVAELKKFERTPAYRYKSDISGEGVYFCVWYLRLRESKYTNNVFDGIIKVEKLITRKKEQVEGVPTELINLISAHLLRERNPVCYGADKRWANHIYPIYVTEQFAKSKYMSNDMFLNLF